MRIRTVKPDYWEDETIGLLSRSARLLFVATFNIADDEGILRWSPPFIKAQAFMYDDDLGVDEVADLMAELTSSGRVYAYEAGPTGQKLAFIVQFHRHQKINRPQPSKLPAPPLRERATRRMYAHRDGWMCALCGNGISEVNSDGHAHLSVGHLKDRIEGGTDHPTNVRATHVTCSKEVYEGPDDEVAESFTDEDIDAGWRELNESRSSSRSGSVNDSVNAALPFEEDFTAGREGNGSGKGREEDLSLTALDARFPEFWSTYPRKVDKKAALTAWRAALRRGASPTHVIQAAEQYATDRSGQDPKFTKHPTTWLNAAAYDNGPEPEERHLRAVSGGYQPYRNPADPSVWDQPLLPPNPPEQR